MNKDKLDSLLSRGRLGGPDHDRILAKALPRRRWTWFAVGGTLFAATAAAMFLVMTPGGFRPRGGSGPVLEAVCKEGPCRVGSTLLFRVASDGGFLHAWADVGGERVWFFPTAEGPAATVPVSTAMTTLSDGVKLDLPGTYRLHLLLAHTALGQAECLAPPPGSTLVTTTLEVVR